MATYSMNDVIMKKRHVMASFEDNDLVLFVNKACSHVKNIHDNLLSGVSHSGRFQFRNNLLVKKKALRLGGL